MMIEIFSGLEDKQAQFRTFQTYLKACKLCIEANTLEMATKTIERAAQVVSQYVH
jgi:hypothetical protein